MIIMVFEGTLSCVKEKGVCYILSCAREEESQDLGRFSGDLDHTKGTIQTAVVSWRLYYTV